MKTLRIISLLGISLLIAGYTAAQNVGIGNPTPQEKLDVDGALKLGAAANNLGGTIQFDGTDIKGHNGNEWKSLTSVFPPGGIVLSDSLNQDIEDAGFKWFGKVEFDPVFLPDSTDEWNAISSIAQPSTLSQGHSAVWTGAEMIVWGRSGTPTASGKYNPSTNTWSSISTAQEPTARTYQSTVWTGTQMIVWGGASGSTYYNDGAIYDPATDTWTAISTTNAPTGRNNHTAIWTGSEMIVWGGSAGSSTYFNSGARYDPVTDTWTAVSLTNAPGSRNYHIATWAGSKMIVWGGYNGSPVGDGKMYDPALDSWSNISATGSPIARYFHSSIWTGTEIIIFGGVNGGNPGNQLNDGYKFDPIANSWSSIAANGLTYGRGLHSAVWTGEFMFIWGGLNISTALSNGAIYYPLTDSWTLHTYASQPSARYRHTGIWTGTEMIIWGGGVSLGSKWCEYCGMTQSAKTFELYIKL